MLCKDSISPNPGVPEFARDNGNSDTFEIQRTHRAVGGIVGAPILRRRDSNAANMQHPKTNPQV